MKLSEKREFFNIAARYPSDAQPELAAMSLELETMDATSEEEMSKEERHELMDNLLVHCSNSVIISAIADNFNNLVQSGNEDANKAKSFIEEAQKEREDIQEIIFEIQKEKTKLIPQNMRDKPDEDAPTRIGVLIEKFTNITTAIIIDGLGEQEASELMPKQFRKDLFAQYYEDKGLDNMAKMARYKAPNP